MGLPVPDDDMPTSIVPAEDLPSAAAPVAAAPAAPLDLWRKHWFGDMDMSKDQPGPGTMWNPTKDQLDAFMKNPPKNYSATDLALGVPSGMLKAGVGYLSAIPAGVAGAFSHLTGAVMAPLADAQEPGLGSRVIEEADQRAHRWSSAVSNTLADLVPTNTAGDEIAQGLMSVPGEIARQGIGEPFLKPNMSENAYTTLSEFAQNAGEDLPATGVFGAATKARAGIVKGTKAARDFYNREAASVNPPGDVPPPPPPETGLGTPVTGDSLRAQPNPIPMPEGSVGGDRQRTAPTATSVSPAPSGGTPIQLPGQPAGDVPAPTPAAGGTTVAPSPEIAAPTPSPEAAPVSSPAESAPLGQTGAGNSQRGSIGVKGQQGAPGRRAVDDTLRTPLFTSPKNEGAQESPTPEMVPERTQHLNDLDKLSGGKLPERRQSALTGDYNATGNDWQDAKVGSKTMQAQLASESDALHAATNNLHDSVGSLQKNSVDPTTLENRGRIVRGAIQAIEQHLSDANDAIYDAARESNQGRPIPKLQRVSDYLNDDSNFTNDAEIGLQRAAKQRLERLWSTGDPDGGVPPGSVNAAERFREFLNEKGKNPSAMGVANDLKGHLDLDVAEHGGPGLFETARNLRRYRYQLLEEPTGVKKLLTPGDSQGINHAIPEHKVPDYINRLPREQHEHLLDVLRAGAHLSPEIAEQSAAALREIQAHTISRLHDAATNDGGKWNARGFYNASAEYARNAASTFKGRPDILAGMQTVNKAGNVLHMDKSYPGAAAQAERATGLGRVVSGAGKVAGTIVGNIIPHGGHIVGSAIERAAEGASGKISEAAREAAVKSRIVDRTGKQTGAVGDLTREREERNPRSEFNANRSIAGQRQLTPEQQDIINRLGGGRPLGDRMPGQRGAVGDLSQRAAVEHSAATRGDETDHKYTAPNGGQLHVTEYPGRGVSQVNSTAVPTGERGGGWGTQMLARAADDAHTRGQVLHSDDQVSGVPGQKGGQVNTYKNLGLLGYDIKQMPHEVRGGAMHAYGDHVFEVRPPKGQPLGAKVPGQRGAVGDLSEHPQTRTPEFKAWSKGAPLITKEDASDHEFKTGRPVVVEAFHGTGRPDRVGDTMRRSRATSGPMPYHTSSPELASNYATGKQDTSLAYENTNYENWFKYRPPGARSDVPIDRMWHHLDPATRQKIYETAPTLHQDDDGNIVSTPGNKSGTGGYDQHVKEARGNPLKALTEEWLSSGNLFGNEEKFMDVLQKAGVPKGAVKYDSPHDVSPAVYRNYIRMSNPLVTSDLPKRVVDALDTAAKYDRSKPAPGGADTWDKNTRTLRDWVEEFHRTEGENSHVWTSIPDKVTKVLKSLGYDGIIDKSGKGGGDEHPVYVPFTETQVKSAIGNKGKFDPNKKSLIARNEPAQNGAHA